MKQLYISTTLIAVLCYSTAIAQTQIFTQEINNYSTTTDSAIIKNSGIILSPNDGSNVTIGGSAKIEFKGGHEVHLKDGFTAGSFTGDGYFRAVADLDQMNAVVLEPTGITSGGTIEVGWFEKIEIGLRLPAEVEDQINFFFKDANSDGQPDYNSAGLNPYNPDEVDVWAEISVPTGVEKESGIVITQAHSQRWNMFFYRDYIEDASSNSWVEKQTEHQWRLRYAPTWKPLNTTQPYVVQLKCKVIKNGVTTTYDLDHTIDFYWKESSNLGYLEAGSHSNFRYGRNNQSMFSVGINLGWGSGFPALSGYPSSTYYDKWKTFESNLTKLQDNNANYARIWMASWDLSIEREKLGVYDKFRFAPNQPVIDRQQAAFDLDKIFTKCESSSQRINVQLCLEDHAQTWSQNLDTTNGKEKVDNMWSGSVWEQHPYYQDNENGTGGITGVFTPNDFLSSTTARAQYQKKLRYIIARWGYSTSLAAIEHYNEADKINLLYANQNTGTIDNNTTLRNNFISYIYSNRNYLKQTLGSKQMQTISYAGYNDSASGASFITDFISSMDFLNPHRYRISEQGNRDRFWELNLVKANPLSWGKPVIWGEVGVGDDGDTKGADELYLETHCSDIDFHNAMWATSLMGTAGCGMNWWWDSPKINNSFQHYKSLNSFFTDIDFENNDYEVSYTNTEGLFHKRRYPQVIGLSEYTDVFPFEVYTMRNNSDGLLTHSDRGFGWIHHRDNWIANRFIGDTLETCTESSAVLNDITGNNYTFRLWDFKAGNYIFEIYDAYSGDLITSYNSSSPENPNGLDNILKFEFPYITLNGSRPDYAFKFWSVDVNGNDLKNTSSQMTNNINSVYPLNAQSNQQTKIAVVQNAPSVHKIKISSTNEIDYTELYDLSGKLIEKSDDMELTSKCELQGLYLLKIVFTSGNVEFRKLIL